MTIKRQSTTAKITASLLATIKDCLQHGEGVIVRFKGQEYGVIDISFGWLLTYCPSGQVGMLDPAQCTIRKGLQDAVKTDRSKMAA
jgi:hypothetical protein